MSQGSIECTTKFNGKYVLNYKKEKREQADVAGETKAVYTIYLVCLFTNENQWTLWKDKKWGERERERLTSSKTKIGPWDNWFTTKWGIYPFIGSKNKIK